MSILPVTLKKEYNDLKIIKNKIRLLLQKEEIEHKQLQQPTFDISRINLYKTELDLKM